MQRNVIETACQRNKTCKSFLIHTRMLMRPTWQADRKLVVPPKRSVANEFASVWMGRAAWDGSSTGGEPAAAQNPFLLHHEGGRRTASPWGGRGWGAAVIIRQSPQTHVHTLRHTPLLLVLQLTNCALKTHRLSLSVLLTAARPPSPSLALERLCVRVRERKSPVSDSWTALTISGKEEA